jgi:hypothetical protein
MMNELSNNPASKAGVKRRRRKASMSWRLCVIEDDLFSLGRLVITRDADAQLVYNSMVEALIRHAKGDWGEISEEDRTLNDAAVRTGGRLSSAYVDEQGSRFWIITEADRSVTTVLLPEDY